MPGTASTPNRDEIYGTLTSAMCSQTAATRAPNSLENMWQDLILVVLTIALFGAMFAFAGWFDRI